LKQWFHHCFLDQSYSDDASNNIFDGIA